MNRMILVRAAVGVLGLLANGCASGPRQVALKFASTSEDTYYECASTTKEQKCQEIAKTSLPQLSNTAYIIVPKECGGQFNQVIIEHAESDSPTAHVICAQIGN